MDDLHDALHVILFGLGISSFIFVGLLTFFFFERICGRAILPPGRRPWRFHVQPKIFIETAYFFFLFLFPVLFSLPGYLIVFCLCFFCVRFGSIFLCFFPKSVQMIYDFY